MQTFLDVKTRVRALVGDPDGDFATDAYIGGFAAQVYDQQTAYLMQAGSLFITKEVVLPGVPQGTTNLSQYQNNNNPQQGLKGLINPIMIEWKQVGQSENYYVEAIESSPIPNVSPTSPPPASVIYWEYRGFIVYVTPVAFAVDMRVRGEFQLQEPRQDNDPILNHPLMAHCMAYGIAALIGADRGNDGWVTKFTTQAENTLDVIANQLVRAGQSTSTRVGRVRRGRGNNNGWGGYC